MKGTSKNQGQKNKLGGIASRRREAVRVKAKKNRSESSRKWLLRQFNDPYVAAAKEEGYRSRAAYKMLQLDEQFKLLKSGQRIVDLGAAPGGWSQVAVKIIGGKGKLIGIDLLPIDAMDGAEFIQMDFLAPEAPDVLKKMLKGEADIVLSDMAHSTIGHAKTDHIRVMALADVAAEFAMEVLTPGGAFVCKFFQGGAEKDLLDKLKKHFAKVRFAKPAASRKESTENYLVAQGFRK